MNKVYKFNDKSMYIVGDIHGDFKSIKVYITAKKIKNSVFLFAGDVGLGFYSKKYYDNELSTLNKFCSKHDVTLLYGRGNHDDKTYFENELINYSNIKTIPDYSVIEINSTIDNSVFRCLFIGGGISIDRTYRINSEKMDEFYYKLRHPNCTDEEAHKNRRVLYWDDEPPIYDEEKLNEIIKEFNSIDYIVSHSAPSFCVPLDKNGITEWMKYDKNLEKDIDDERMVFTNVYEYLKKIGKLPKGWAYGHFHNKHSEIINGVLFTMLDCSQNKLDVLNIK